MSAAYLKDLPMTRRTGALVIHEHLPFIVWAHGPVGGNVTWLLRPGEGLVAVEGHIARHCQLVTPADIYRPGAKKCIRADHPDADPLADQCPTCGLAIEPAA